MDNFSENVDVSKSNFQRVVFKFWIFMYKDYKYYNGFGRHVGYWYFKMLVIQTVNQVF